MLKKVFLVKIWEDNYSLKHWKYLQQNKISLKYLNKYQKQIPLIIPWPLWNSPAMDSRRFFQRIYLDVFGNCFFKIWNLVQKFERFTDSCWIFDQKTWLQYFVIIKKKYFSTNLCQCCNDFCRTWLSWNTSVFEKCFEKLKINRNYEMCKFECIFCKQTNEKTVWNELSEKKISYRSPQSKTRLANDIEIVCLLCLEGAA